MIVPARQFGRGLAKTIASAREKNPALIEAMAQPAPDPRQKDKYLRRWETGTYVERHHSLNRLKQVFGMPFHRWYSEGNQVFSVPVAARESSGPLAPRPDDPSVVEGLWRLGKNGGMLKSIVRALDGFAAADKESRLRHGTVVGLRASESDGKLYVTVFPDAKNPNGPSHTFLAEDADEVQGIEYTPIAPSDRPKAHTLPLARIPADL